MILQTGQPSRSRQTFGLSASRRQVGSLLAGKLATIVERSPASRRDDRRSWRAATRLGLLWALGISVPASAQVLELSELGEVTVHQGYGQIPATDHEPQGKAGNRSLPGDPYSDAARRHGLDANLLRAVAWTESRGRNSAISRKGAIGIMQLMPGTAAAMGVDPHDPLANIEGGAAYLAQQLATFGSVPLALAAYNAGPGAVVRHRGVPPYAETRHYVQSILSRIGTGIASTPAAPSLAAAFGSPNAAPARLAPLPFLLIEVPGE